MLPTKRDNSTLLLVAGVLGLAGMGVAGVLVGGKILERVIERIGKVVEEVAAATGTAIGGGVSAAWTPDPTIPEDLYRLPDAEGEAYIPQALDPTYGFIPPSPNGHTIAVVQPGDSLIPGEEA